VNPGAVEAAVTVLMVEAAGVVMMLPTAALL
jgi:hypothetical protein